MSNISSIRFGNNAPQQVKKNDDKPTGLATLPKDHPLLKLQAAPKQPVFQDLVSFNQFTLNSKDSLFLKKYLDKHLESKGVQKPAGVDVNISSPRAIPDDIKHAIHDVAFKQFHGHLHTVFELLKQPDETFHPKVDALKVPQETKEKLTKLHDFLDNYYWVELDLPNGEKLELTNTKPEIKEQKLKEHFPNDQQFVNEVMAASENLEILSRKFGVSEFEKATMEEGAHAAKHAVKEFGIGVGAIVVGDQILEHLAKRMGGSAEHIVEYALGVVAGFDDDSLGGYTTDYKNDNNTFGKDRAESMRRWSVLAGVAASLTAPFFAPPKLAEGAAHKAKEATNFVGKTINSIKQFSKNNPGKGAVVYGLLTSMGLVASMVGSYGMLVKDTQKNIDSGLLDVPKGCEKGLKKNLFVMNESLKNFAANDTFLGKVIGFATVPFVAIGAQRAGMFNKSGIVNALGFILVGSVESYVKTGVQILRSNWRDMQIRTSKEIVTDTLAHPNKFNERNPSVDGHAGIQNISRNMKNFAASLRGDA